MQVCLCPKLTVFVLEHSGGPLPPAPSMQWQPSSSLHLKMPFQVSMLGQMPEDTPGDLFFPTEVSAVGSVPMCQGTSHRVCQAGQSETFSTRERQQPEALVLRLWHPPAVSRPHPGVPLALQGFALSGPEWDLCSHCLWIAVEFGYCYTWPRCHPPCTKKLLGSLPLVAILRCSLK